MSQVNEDEEFAAILDDIQASWGDTSCPEAVEREIRLADRVRQREELRSRLEDEGEDGLAEMLAGCGRPMELTCTCCGEVHEIKVSCRKRWCPVCAWRISAARVARYSAAVQSMQWPLFVTLTRPNVKVIDLDVIRDMRRAFRRLRQRAAWARNVRGGVASLEITNTGRGWHPHIHAVIDCRWLALKTPAPRPIDSPRAIQRKCKQAATEVGTLWAQCMRLPRASVKVKRAYGSGSTADPTGRSGSIATEVLKYSVKATDLIESPDPIGPVLRVIGAARLVTSWGSCYGSRLVVDEPDRVPTACTCGASGTMMPSEYVIRWAHAQPAWDDRLHGSV